MPDKTRWPRRVQSHQRIELIFQDHHHVNAPQEFSEHDTLVDTLALAERIARIRYLLPVFERCALVVPPKLRAHIELLPIAQPLMKSTDLPVSGTATEILGDVEAECVGHHLMLDGGKIEVMRRCDAALRECDAVIDRFKAARTEHLARLKLGWHNRRCEIGKHRATICT